MKAKKFLNELYTTLLIKSALDKPNSVMVTKQGLDVLKQSLDELEELGKNNQIILELLVKLLSMNMLGQEGLIIVNKIKNVLTRSDKDE